MGIIVAIQVKIKRMTEVLGVEKKAPATSESEERTPEYYKKRPCADMVALAAEILEKYLAK